MPPGRNGWKADISPRASGLWARALFVALTLAASPQAHGATVNVDCSTGGVVAQALSSLKPGDVVLVHGTCQENLLIQPDLQSITIDGQGKAAIEPTNSQQPAIQVLGREITIRGFTLTGGYFGIAISRGASGVVEKNVIQGATVGGIEVSHNSFARIVNNTIRDNVGHGIMVLGSSSAHIGVYRTDDVAPSPNIIENNGGNGIWVLRASTARIIGNTLSRNRRNGLEAGQASHADVAGNVFDGNGESGILVAGNSGLNLADSAMRLFEQPNRTVVPNNLFGVRCAMGAYVGGPVASLRGRRGVKDVSDTSCVDRSIP